MLNATIVEKFTNISVILTLSILLLFNTEELLSVAVEVWMLLNILREVSHLRSSLLIPRSLVKLVEV
jgi:hypothetical protein